MGITPATDSYGAYRADPSCGGLFRIAVLPGCQGRGIGAYIISYGCLRLQAAGFARIEDIITYKRRKSLLLHYRLGFVPKRLTECVVPLYGKPKSLRNKIYYALMHFLLRKDKFHANLLSHR